MKYHSMPTRVAITKIIFLKSVGKDVEKLEHLYFCGMNVK